GPPLLVAAFAFFFRREVATNAELAREFTFESLQRLGAAQESAFAEVAGALVTHGKQLDDALDLVLGIKVVVEATHEAVLDLQPELQRQRGVQQAGTEEACRLIREVLALLGRSGMQTGAVRAQHSLSIRSEEERRVVRQLLDRFRQMPEDRQKQLPALLNG